MAQTVSLLGDQVTLVAMPLVAVLTLRAGAAQMGYLAAAGLAPNLLFAVAAGAWVESRGGCLRLMIAADLLRAALLLTVPLAYALGLLTLAQLYLVAFAAGTLSVLFYVSYNTLFATVVPRDRYVRGRAQLSGSRAFSFVGGPGLGGALVQLLRAPLALGADALSFLASALVLSRISADPPPPSADPDRRPGEGFRHLLGSPVLRPLLAATATINLFTFAFFTLFVLYANRVLGLAPGEIGLVLGLGAVGAVVGSLLSGALVRRLGIGRTLALGCLAFPAPLILVPLASGPELRVLALLFGAEFLSGLGVAMLDVSAESILTAAVPPALRSRTAGAYLTVNYGVRPIGALLGGELGSTIGLRPTLSIAVIGASSAILCLQRSSTVRLRTLPQPI